MMNLQIAYLPGGAGPVGLPLMLLLGWTFLNNQIARYACLVLLILWLIWFSANAMLAGEWGILMFPGIVIIAWIFIMEVNHSF